LFDLPAVLLVWMSAYAPSSAFSNGNGRPHPNGIAAVAEAMLEPNDTVCGRSYSLTQLKLFFVWQHADGRIKRKASSLPCAIVENAEPVFL